MRKESVGRYTAAIYRNTQIYINQKLKNHGIKSGQHDFLYVIINNEGITQTEICNRLNVGKPTVTKAVNSLVKNDYVKREKNIEDNRSHQLFLTNKGKRIAPMINATFDELIEVYKRNLSSEEYHQVLQGLEIILNNISSAKE